MCVQIQEVFLSSEYQSTYLTSPDTDSTDVIVLLNNGERYVASCFTYDYISDWQEKEKDSKENFYGKYFWVPNMMIVDHCSRDNIIKIVQELIDEGDFNLVFKKIISTKKTRPPLND